MLQWLCYAPQAMDDSVLIVAGEASADAHGRSVIDALRAKRPDLRLFGVGGRRMREAGFEACVRAEDISVAGLTEVVWALPRLLRSLRQLAALAAAQRPKVALLIDLPDFNLRLARRLKRLGIPVIYYISPQLWAWRKRRIQQIRAYVDKMLVILPFEADFYAQHQVPVKFVGHPLLEQLAEPLQGASAAQARQMLHIDPQAPGPFVALLPGSRRKEVARHLPRMLDALALLKRTHPQLQALMPVASTVPQETIKSAISAWAKREPHSVPVHVIDGEADLALCASDAAVVCSGTATLQAALMQRPQVVVYRVSWLTYQLLKRLISVPHIALVNLIAGKRLVTELIQNNFSAAALATHVQELLSPRAPSLHGEFAALREKLGLHGAAEAVAAEVMAYVGAPSPETLAAAVAAAQDAAPDSPTLPNISAQQPPTRSLRGAQLEAR
jgi:lipid-A-disaccharide synthase